MASASMTNPIYTVNLIKSNGTKYRLKDVTTDLVVSHAKDELAEKVTLSLVNVKVGTKYLRSIIALKDKVYVYANTGSGAKLVFQGFVWERQLTRDGDTNEIQLICYDRLIYLHKCKDNYFAKKGTTTKNAITQLAKKWGFKISYKYESISNTKLVYHNESIADMMTSILNKAKKKTGKSYVIRMEKNVIVIETAGSNSTIYKIQSKDNAITTSYRQTMEDMVTKVKIVKAETVKKGDSDKESGKYLTVTSVSKNTKEYGTLQEILVKEKDDKLSDVKKEANKILDKNSKPHGEVEVKAIDNPWIKKGHKVYIAAGNLKNYYIVKGIEHDSVEHSMYLEVRKA